MGDPIKPKKKFERPPTEWNAERIAEENELKLEFGLKSTREVWKARAELRRIRANARKLLAAGDSGKEKAKEILDRVKKYGFLKQVDGKEYTLDDLLVLNVRDLLERRLQTRVFKKGLARTPKQARQLITHGYIAVGGKRITVPSYLVSLSEEDSISYYRKIDIQPKMAENAAPVNEKDKVPAVKDGE
ncbi:MAG: 30S ribosomal protein S4 [Candidatus Micrarchaeia archaeon]